MKQEENNEMDVLLRSLGRKAEVRATIEDPEGRHLDADELNAYAERALPAAAHSRYTKHIADCSRCRSIVSQLSAATGVVVEEKVKEPVAVQAGLIGFLASFFSPIVLRYAVPALVLLIVASVGFLAFRQSTEMRFAKSDQAGNTVAQKQPEQPANAAAETGRSDGTYNGFTNGQIKQKTQAEVPKESTASADDQRKTSDEKTARGATGSDQAAGAPSSAPATAAAEPPPATKPAATPVKTEESAKKDADAVVAVDTVAIAKANEREADKQANREAKAPAKVAQPMAGGFGDSVSGQAKAKGEVTRSRSDAPRDAEGRRQERDNKEVAEVRSISGRRFRKEGSVWIDVAYSSQATTNVSRGSEQYRALVADEPGIKTIADQLDGEVIVVWKSRAYKIK